MVSDQAAPAKVPQPTKAAVSLVVSLAAERFDNRPVIVKGTEVFREQIAAVAAIEGMFVTLPALRKSSSSNTW